MTRTSSPGQGAHIQKRWFAYAAAGAASFGVHTAQADLVFNSGNVAPGTSVFDSTLDLDIDGDGTNDFTFINDLNGGFSGAGYAVASVQGLGANLIRGYSNSSFFYASNLAASFSLSSAPGAFVDGGYFWDGNGFYGSQFPSGTTGFVGFQFLIGGNIHYGFAQIAISDATHPTNPASTDNAITILNYAYQDIPGAPAHVFAIPEPGSLGLLALGSVGLVALRRRRKQEV